MPATNITIPPIVFWFDETVANLNCGCDYVSCAVIHCQQITATSGFCDNSMI